MKVIPKVGRFRGGQVGERCSKTRPIYLPNRPGECQNARMEIFDRHLTSILSNQIEQNGILPVMGPCQAGKMTLIQTILPKHTGRDAVHVSFDDPDERVRFHTSTIPVIRQLKAPPILLDEVQNAP